MNNPRNTLSSQWTEFALLGLLSLLWGGSYALINLAVETITPVTLVAIRVMIAASVLWLVVIACKKHIPKAARTWRKFLIQAMLGFVIPFTMITWGQQFVPSGLAGILNSTTPIFVFLASAFLAHGERSSGEHIFGVMTGLGGVCLLIGLEALEHIGTDLAGQLAITGATVSYAAAMIYGKTFKEIAPEVTAACTLTLASCLLLPASFIVEDPLALSPSQSSVLSLVTLAVLCTAGAFTLYFRLVNTLGSVGTSSVAYSRAAIAVIIGVLLLGESFGFGTALGMVAVLTGVVAINGQLFALFRRKIRLTV